METLLSKLSKEKIQFYNYEKNWKGEFEKVDYISPSNNEEERRTLIEEASVLSSRLMEVIFKLSEED